MSCKRKKVLVIGGSDPTTGAGIQVDILTLLEFGVFPYSVITSVTSQNSQGVQNTYHVLPKMLKTQLKAVFDDVKINAVKIGMLGSKKNVLAICNFFETFSFSNIVLDPVFKSSSGYVLLEKEGISVLKSRLLPLVKVVTPNILEAEELAGFSVTNIAGAKKAAKTISLFGSEWVLVKGGHLKGERCVDVLYGKEACFEYSGRRLKTRDVRGKGCILSSSLAAYLACDLSVREAVGKAKSYAARKIEDACNLGKGRPQMIPTFVKRGG